MAPPLNFALWGASFSPACLPFSVKRRSTCQKPAFKLRPVCFGNDQGFSFHFHRVQNQPGQAVRSDLRNSQRRFGQGQGFVQHFAFAPVFSAFRGRSPASSGITPPPPQRRILDGVGALPCGLQWLRRTVPPFPSPPKESRRSASPPAGSLEGSFCAHAKPRSRVI